MNISVIGLGKLGIPLAAILAYKGHTVIGVDVNLHIIRLLNEGRSSIFEPGLEGLIQKSRVRLSATVDYQLAINGTEITFIIVPTPSDALGDFSLHYVLAATETIGKILRDKKSFHLVVLISTVMPGDTDHQVLPVLETYSAKRCGIDFGLCYNPEFIALGSVIRDMLNPDFILIGESDARAGEMLASLYEGICDNNPPVIRMNFVNAELAKLAVNTFVTTKISYANMLAQICEQLPDANVDIVTSAIGLDSRIGRKYLKGALGYGGPCFPRDNTAFARMACRLGIQAGLAEITHHINRLQVPRLAEIVMPLLSASSTVGILGLSYKPNTNVVEEAPGIELARYLIARGISVILYDPVALENARDCLAGEGSFASTLEECTRRANIVIITTPDEEFKALSPEILNYSEGKPTLVDCWRTLSRQQYEPFANYIAIGIGPHLDGPTRSDN